MLNRGVHRLADDFIDLYPATLHNRIGALIRWLTLKKGLFRAAFVTGCTFSGHAFTAC